MSRDDPFRVDWFALLIDLQRHGFPTSQVAKMVDVPVGTVMGWKNGGAEPRHVDGDRLVDLWVGITGKNRHQVPRVDC